MITWNLLCTAVALPEPVKIRPTEAKETAKLSDFQKELVQMAAVLNGDHKSDMYPHELVEKMTVAEAAKYVNGACEKFCDEYQRGEIHESEIVELEKQVERPKPRSSIYKFFSCIVCHD